MRDRDTARFKPMHHVVIVPAAPVLTAALAVSSLLGEDGLIRYTRTNADGAYAMEHVRPGD